MQDLASIDAMSVEPVRHLELRTGPEKRWRYTDAEKARLVAETFQPAVSIADVARRHGVHPQLLYTWRRQARRGELALNAEDAPMFAAVLAELDAPSDPSEATPDDSVEIILGDLTVRIGSGVSPQRVAALISALRSVS